MMQINDISKDNASCDKYRPSKEYTHLQEFFDNLPYIFMILIGTLIILLGLKMSLWGIIAAGLFILYGILGTLWIILFICPYCHYFDTKACPCGYGQIAVKLRDKQSEKKFPEKFKKYIPVIVPLWILPVIGGIYFLYYDFNYVMLTLLIVFCLNSYIILPLLARIYGCGHCPQKNDCPWMTKEKDRL